MSVKFYTTAFESQHIIQFLTTFEQKICVKFHTTKNHKNKNYQRESPVINSGYEMEGLGP